MTYSTTRRNPYIIGRPINETELIFGRESLFHFIEDNLRQNIKVILLHGQRRMGKSSVLLNIPKFVAPDRFAFVPFDLQDKSQKPFYAIIYALITEISDYLEIDSDEITLPSTTDLEKDPYIFSRQFLPQVYKVLDGKKLVLLLDEFDALSNEVSDSVVKNFFSYLHLIAKTDDKLFIIPFAGRKSDDLPNLLNVFKEAPFQEIGLLDELSAKRLITKPSQGVLEYDSDAIRAILELSVGHPYFTQIICFALFGRARELQNWKITREDVVSVIEKAIELAAAGLIWFWEGLSIPEKVVFSAVAEAQKIAISNNQAVSEEPLKLLEKYGVIKTNSLIQAVNQLVKKGFLDNTECRVKVELIRRWLVQRYSLRQEISQLEKLAQEEVTPLWEVATKLCKQDKKQDTLTIYEKILEINPNHFSTVIALAKGYLEVEDFDKAVELYTRAYLFDPIRNQEGLLQALQASAQQLITKQEFTRAKEQLNQVLEIEPNNRSARTRLREIEVEIEPKIEASKRGFLVAENKNNTSQYNSREKYNSVSSLLPTIAATVGIMTILGGVGVYLSITSCSAGEQNVLGISCVVSQNTMSRGDRILFPNIKNPTRDVGIEAFKQGNYSEAAEFFQISLVANRNDPEVLIYYNNARAAQQPPSDRLTLAVVVPIENAESTAKEILRGVAQAQKQFNDKGGSNGRLLEIAIAKDADEPDKAKQVAAELVNDSSVLGVIGQNSSKALAEYEKADLAIISPTTTNALLTSHVFFTTVPSYVAIGNKLAEYTKNSLGLNKVLIFFNSDSVYSNSLKEEFTKKFEQLKGQVVSKDLTDPKLSLEKEVLKNQARAFVLFPDAQDISVALETAKVNANLIARSHNAKSGLKLLGGDTLYTKQTLQEGGKAVEGLILVIPWFRDAPQSKNFAQAAAKQWGGAINWRTATSFDATQAFIQALSSSSNPSRSTVLRNLKYVKLSSSETSGEALQFTSKGERQSQPVLVKVENGKFVLVKYKP